MRGYFGIGIYHGKNTINHGTLWRSAYQLGASYIFTVGSRFSRQSSDTMKADRHIPCYEYSDFENFLKYKPLNAITVAVEMGGKSLTNFSHPSQCVYILGAEDHGLPEEVINQCQQVISIPAIRAESYNVAVAGSLVMYDRISKNVVFGIAV